MMILPPFRVLTALLALLGATLLVFGILNFWQRINYQLPDDGVSWVDWPQGVTAWIVAAGGPGERAGVREGDILMGINGRSVIGSLDAVVEIFRSGVWSQVTYDLVRQGEKFQTRVVLAPQTKPESLRHYLDLLGLLYLVIGAFILARRRALSRSLHLYVFCLASFVLYTFSYTGRLDLFDWAIYWLNVFALVLQPPLFLHFCLIYPQSQNVPGLKCYQCALVYLPGALLFAFHLLVATGILLLPFPLLVLRWMLDRVGLMYLGAYFLAGGVLLIRSCRRTQVPLYKQQLKLVARGTFLAISPFATLYALPYFLGFVPAPWMMLSVFSLIFLPLTFGYGLLRWAPAEMQLSSQAAELVV